MKLWVCIFFEPGIMFWSIFSLICIIYSTTYTYDIYMLYIYICYYVCIYVYIHATYVYIYIIYIYILPYITHMCIHMLYLYILDTNGLHSSFAEGLVFHLFIYFLLVSLSLCVSIHVYTYPDAPCSMVLEYLPLLPMHLPQNMTIFGVNTR